MAIGHSLKLFSQTTPKTVANSAIQTTLIDGGVGSVAFPADFFTVGKTLRIKMFGFHSATAGPTIQMRVKLNSTVILDTGTVNTGNGTNDLMELDALITCNAVGDGATGKVLAQGTYLEYGAGPGEHQMVNSSFVFLDTEIAQTLDITVQWGTADPGNTITSTNILVEAI